MYLEDFSQSGFVAVLYQNSPVVTESVKTKKFFINQQNQKDN